MEPIMATKMKKNLILLMVFSLLVCSGNVIGEKRRGADLVVTKTDGQQITGELVAVKPSSLLLLDSRSGVDVSADVNDIRDIIIVKRSKALLGAGIGFLAGAASGALWAYLAYQSANKSETLFGNQEEEMLGWGAILGGAGALIGAVVGILSGTDKTIQFEGKSPEEIRAILEKLRRQARVTDFQ
jgi:hypothetical protein